MKHILLAATLCLALAASGSRAEAAAPSQARDEAAAAPHVVPVWWSGPATVCHRNFYGGVWCRPAPSVFWRPRPYGWGPYWVPGYWRRGW